MVGFYALGATKYPNNLRDTPEFRRVLKDLQRVPPRKLNRQNDLLAGRTSLRFVWRKRVDIRSLTERPE